ncbi:uncharacterized protein Pyn_08893 [Prunus yedoensis var. nudiflora]|uniref:DUF868 domain-containing protein n=1 Tax=Prunus yedoensis var. nudiflora TaxID=2094558 RepID=A0A314ZI57_PRUYE|nr:uncharacterized protein Pyn_08893 [Prunus yedoensis var. nudiflora]
MMRDFPSCFGENGVQVADSSSSSSSRITKIAQNLVSCVYQCKLQGRLCFITVTWTKNLMGQGLSIEIDDAANQCLCKVDIKPWLFSKRKGCKNLEVDTSKIDIYWDLTNAKFGSGPEPLEKFYLAVMFNQEMVLFLGDLKREAFNKDPVGSISRATFIAKESTFLGRNLCKMVMQVKRLNWKFRGNHTILVDGLRIEVFWDVHNWLFGNAMGNAVFMFQTCLSDDNKFWTSPPVLDPSVLAWSSSQPLRDNQLQGLGFSLVLHAWKNE